MVDENVVHERRRRRGELVGDERLHRVVKNAAPWMTRQQLLVLTSALLAYQKRLVDLQRDQNAGSHQTAVLHHTLQQGQQSHLHNPAPPYCSNRRCELRAELDNKGREGLWRRDCAQQRRGRRRGTRRHSRVEGGRHLQVGGEQGKIGNHQLQQGISLFRRAEGLAERSDALRQNARLLQELRDDLAYG